MKNQSLFVRGAGRQAGRRGSQFVPRNARDKIDGYHMPYIHTYMHQKQNTNTGKPTCGCMFVASIPGAGIPQSSCCLGPAGLGCVRGFCSSDELRLLVRELLLPSAYLRLPQKHRFCHRYVKLLLFAPPSQKRASSTRRKYDDVVFTHSFIRSFIHSFIQDGAKHARVSPAVRRLQQFWSVPPHPSGAAST